MFVEIIFVGLTLVVLERIFPDQTLPRIPSWWSRVVLINCAQLLVVVLGGLTWDAYLQKISLTTALRHQPALLGGFIAYLILTFVYYWWHRARHDLNLLWVVFHQLHHSPNRIETLTSFYKHPLEIIANSIITGLVTYALLGLTIEAAAWTTVFGAMAEFFYHMNIRTPHWLGYLIQRPEMHRVHHRRGLHYKNFADLPLWDMLFGTFENPHRNYGLCGFKVERELRLWEMLTFRNVNSPLRKSENQ